MRCSFATAVLLVACSLRSSSPDARPSAAPSARSRRASTRAPRVTPAPSSELAGSAGPLRASTAARREFVELGRQADSARLQRDVRTLARPRELGSVGSREVNALLQRRLTELGYQVERQAYGSGVNLIGTLAGERAEPVVVSAHYDHIARCAGADDNASGLAAALEIARLLAPRTRLRPIVVAFWDEEERGLLGSSAFARRARERKEPIAVVISFDAIGFFQSSSGSQRVPTGFAQLLPEEAALLAQRQYRADFLAMVANPGARAMADRLATYAAALELPRLRVEASLLEAAFLPDLFRSDHAAFWLAGYPALLLTDTAELRNPHYHCGKGPDSAQSLNYDALTRGTGAALAAIADTLESP